MFGGVNPPGTPPFLCTFFFGGQVQAGGERKGGVGVGAAVTSAVSSTAAPRPAALGARVLCLLGVSSPLLSRWEQGFWCGVFFLKIFLFW